MSTVFEAFVLGGEYGEVAAFLEEKRLFDFEVVHLELEEDKSFLYIDTESTLDPEIIENIAKALSEEFGQCLYVYSNEDDSSSYAMIYDETGFLDMFGEEDEIWVETNENGYPDTKGTRYTKQEVLENQDSEKNFACVFNCLDAALLRLDPYVSVKGQALVALAEEAGTGSEEEEEEDSDGFF